MAGSRLLLASVLLLGCSSQSLPVAPPGDGGPDSPSAEAGPESGAPDAPPDRYVAEASTGDGGDGPGCPSMTRPNPMMCAVPAQCGPVVTPVWASGMPPAAQGGMLSPGVYVLTAENLYGGGADAGTLHSEQMTQQYDAAGTFSVNDYVAGNQNPPEGGSWMTMGTMLVRTYNGCPDTLTISRGYTASPTTLTIYKPLPPITYEFVMTKQ